MVIDMETLLVASLIGNICTEIAKLILKSPAQDAEIDRLHAALNDALAQLRQLIK